MLSNTTTARSRDGSTPTDEAPPTMRGLIVPALIVLVAAAVFVSLGNWQVRRLAWKEDLIASVAARPLLPPLEVSAAAAWAGLDIATDEYRRVRLVGHFLHESEALVFTSLPDPQGPEGGPGFWVVTPFALSGGGTVLVNRGFAPQGRHLPAQRGESLSDDGPQTVEGLVRRDERRSFLTPADRPDENIFFARAIADIAAAKGPSGPLAPFTIDLVAAEAPPGGLPQAGETRMTFTNNHVQYAITWYGLAAALLAVFLGFVARRRRERAAAAP